MKIQTLVMDDYPYVKELWQQCGLSDEPEDQKEDIGSLLDAPQSTGFVAMIDGHIKGAVLCGNDGRYGYIHHLAVSKTIRNQGIGKALVEACIAFLAYRHIIIMVRETNTTGIEFWNHLQFKHANWINVQFLNSK